MERSGIAVLWSALLCVFMLQQSFQFRNIKSLLIIVTILLLDSEYLVLDGKESIHHIRIKVASPPLP